MQKPSSKAVEPHPQAAGERVTCVVSCATVLSTTRRVPSRSQNRLVGGEIAPQLGHLIASEQCARPHGIGPVHQRDAFVNTGRIAGTAAQAFLGAATQVGWMTRATEHA